MRYFVYILRCVDGSLYTGMTNDLKKRMRMHAAGKASAYTRAKGAVKMVYTERKKDRGFALRREAEIKRWPRSQKLALIRAWKTKKR